MRNTGKLLVMVAIAAAGAGSGCGTRVGGKLFARPATSAPSTTAPSTTAPSTTAPSTTAPSTTTTLDAAVAKTEITSNWEKFFDANTPLADREALLENGSQYQQALVTASQNPLQSQASAVVHNVSLTAPDRATVTYDELLNGKPALPGALGVAVLQGGTWKVSGQTFCGVVTLAGPVPGCS